MQMILSFWQAYSKIIIIIDQMIQFRIHSQYYDNQSAHPDSSGRLFYFLLPYVLLLVVSYFFHWNSVKSQFTFPIYPLPTQEAQNLIYCIIVVLLGLIGLFSALGNYWSGSDWLLYAVANILLALYVFLYQLTIRLTLFLTTVTAVFLAIVMQWLFIQTADMWQGTQKIIIRNFVGAVGAWALIYALLTMGQFFVYTLSLNRTFQSFCFFIVAMLLLILIAFWNRQHYCQWSELICYLGVGAFLLIFSAMHVRSNSNSDLENLIS